ncbi:MAG: hypothetical protein KF752_09715 [Pirellulaceae bacterium]|nr:hypothetical protein [Pirellulaceae bacterium]
MGKKVMGAKLDDQTKDLLKRLGEIDRCVARWSTAEDASEGQALLDLTKCVNEIASSQGVIGAAFSVLDPSQSTIALTRTYMRKSSIAENSLSDEFKLFRYKAPTNLANRFPQFFDSLKAARTGYSDFIDSLFQVQRGNQRTNDPDGMLPEFLKKDIEGAVIAPFKEICNYLAAWLFLLYSAANAEYGLLSSNAVPNLKLTVGEALYKALKRTPHHTRRTALGFDDFDLFFRAFGREELSDSDLFARLLMECTLGDIVPSIAEQAAFKNRASDLQNKLRIDSNSPIISRLHDISQKAPFPLIPYLSLVALTNGEIAHAIIPLHSTRSFKHQVVISEGVVQARNCGVFLLATVDQEIADIPALTALSKAMASPILDSVYYGGFQKKLIERELIGESIRSFAHQIRSLSGSIGGRWLVPPSVWPGLRDHAIKKMTEHLVSEEKLNIDVATQVAREKAKGYLTAPDPKIFSALSSTLKLWSLTFTLTDLFGSSEFGPQNAVELIQEAVSYAEDCTYLRKTSGLDRTDSVDLAEAWLCESFLGERTIDSSSLKNLHFKFSSGVCDWSKPLAEFKYQGREEEPDTSRRFAIELAGVFRLYVLAVENFTLHSTDNATLRLSWEAVANKRIRMQWETNGVKPKLDEERLFLSFRGEEVFDFVARTFLKYRQPVVRSAPQRDGSRYWCAVEFDKPDWIISEERK